MANLYRKGQFVLNSKCIQLPYNAAWTAIQKHVPAGFSCSGGGMYSLSPSQPDSWESATTKLGKNDKLLHTI